MKTDDRNWKKIVNSYNYESTPGEEFFAGIYDYLGDKGKEGRIHRIVLVSGNAKHVPIFRTRVHYDSVEGKTYYSGTHHYSTGMGYTDFNGRRTAVVKVVSGDFSRTAPVRESDLSVELEKLDLKFYEKKTPIKKATTPKTSRDENKETVKPKKRNHEKKDTPSVGETARRVKETFKEEPHLDQSSSVSLDEDYE